MKRAEIGHKGFTVIELLITLATLGIVALSLMPKLLRTPGSAVGKPTWLTDQVGAAAAGEASTTVDLADYRSIDQTDLVTILVPEYLQEVPELDGWKNRFEYDLDAANPLAEHVIAIRSAGRDGLTDADIYTVTSFDPSDYDQDILWADGFFVRWPQS